MAVGTGQAIKNAKNGDADVLIVHAKSAELKFVEQGYGVQRHNLMYNDFVVVGPNSDPAKIVGMHNVIDALKKITKQKALFASRGDDSGTHKKELKLWEIADFDVRNVSGSWYRETGSGMGATLNIAVAMQAYTITDRATWIKFGNKQNFQIAVEGDPELFNQYGVIVVNPKRHRHVKYELAQQFVQWLLSDIGQSAIADYRVQNLQLFFPNAIK